ncbi:uncharacterized protein LOC119104556 [Pollicipes pollicipes]|uniref:uncharacterized protein LOC119104556 n=1 Tax=Pollicipes pollicipes TaxID=41117 RepID=UPI0018859104|nr:uncharacterized protein LOC119104556 [Pollicipes pollicipes]
MEGDKELLRSLGSTKQAPDFLGDLAPPLTTDWVYNPYRCSGGTQGRWTVNRLIMLKYAVICGLVALACARPQEEAHNGAIKPQSPAKPVPAMIPAPDAMPGADLDTQPTTFYKSFGFGVGPFYKRFHIGGHPGYGHHYNYGNIYGYPQQQPYYGHVPQYVW